MLEAKAFMLLFVLTINGPEEGLNILQTKDLVAHRVEIYKWAKKEQIVEQDWWWDQYMFNGADEDFFGEFGFREHLRIIHRAYHSFKNVPKLEEFPLHKYNFGYNKSIIRNKLLMFNREYEQHLRERLIWEIDREDLLRPAIKETELCYKVWDLISDLNSDYYGDGAKRLKYVELKNLIGEEWFSGPELYPYVPVWRFTNK